MKKLQNNFTTTEQSKRLLELGVPAWTADCYYYEECNVCNDSTPQVVPFGEIWTDESKETIFSSYVDVPCWSVGRLIEISELCYTSLFDNDYFIRQKDCNIDFLIKMFELGIDRMDFSKLED